MSDKHKGNDYKDLTLNDVAVLLIQLEPDDTSELVSFREILDTVADDPSHPELSRQKIAKAAQLVASLSETDATASEGTDILDKVGSLIEEAMNAMEDDFAVPAKVAPEPAAPQPQDVAEDPPVSPPSSGGEVSPFEIELPDDTDVELISAFITESNELIEHAEASLLILEKNPQDMDAVNTVFRTFHNIKGTSAFFDLSLMTEMAHHAESFLSRIRDGEIRYSGGYADLSLRAMYMMKDLFRSLQSAMEGSPFLKPVDYDDLLHTLADPEKDGISGEDPGQEWITEDAVAGQKSVCEMEARELTEDVTEDQMPEAVQDAAEDAESEVPDFDSGPELPEISASEPDPETLEPDETLSSPPEPVPAPRAAPVPPKPKPQKPKGQKAFRGNRKLLESSVRVPVTRLDQFIDMVGELVVAHSMMAQDKAVISGKHHTFFKKVSQTSKIVRELQNMSMSMRMVPLKPTFRKMARLVRDLARKLDKNVTFATVVDIINDPLVHMVRNAVDHGIEAPEERERSGKPSYGVVKLSAYHSAGDVVVKIEDDGQGFDREAIFANALSRGLIGDGQQLTSLESGERLRSLSDREVFGLIFEPGFSTVQVVSEVSGRGVGMDVVKKNIEKIRGQIEIQSTPGKGAVFKINIPLTLAIIDGMVVRVGSEKYVMPTVSIVRSVRPKAEDLSSVLRQGEMLSLRGRLIPVFRLSGLFGIRDAEQDPTQAIVMVVEDDGRQAGVLVDELIGSQQIVIKTLGETMRNIPGISGSAIMPDGRVGLILDVGGLVGLATHTGH
ncbi:MAG: hypothetical protein B6245_19045 [Desulfobacteraceae bacterium 4572_88]|nr:MAG: hypothetical protein B6245_19045 [Desulfobacteraceae bacterium 4572_88]